MDKTINNEPFLFLLLLIPFVVCFVPGIGLADGSPIPWIAFLVCGGIIWTLVLWRMVKPPAARYEPRIRMLTMEEYPEPIKELMEVRAATEESGTTIFKGRLKKARDQVNDQLNTCFKDKAGVIVVAKPDEDEQSAILLFPKAADEPAQRGGWFEWLLIGASVALALLPGNHM
jgi:hypothetical protein